MSFNLKEEVIGGHLVTEDRKQLWAVEMDIANKLLEVCDKHNLRVWADGGTLLGAVRHRAFIPWDDDMDFTMFREDYDKFVEIGPSEFSYPYYFQSFYTDNANGTHVKIRRSDTAMIESDFQYRTPHNSGVFIDVLVLDAIPDNIIKYKRQILTISFYRRLLNRYTLFTKRFNKTLYMKIVYAIAGICFLINKPISMHNHIEENLRSNNIYFNKNVGQIGFYVQFGHKIDSVPQLDKHWYDETVMLPFNDMMIPVPKKYHEVLEAYYGDYLIPVKGTELHSILKYDCNRSYLEVLKELDGQPFV